MAKSTKQFLYETIYKDLKNKIEEAVYSAGSLLPSEKDLGVQYAVDRVTIRTALKLLVNEKMVEKIPGVGTRVIYGYTDKNPSQSTDPQKMIGFYIMEDDLPNSGLSQPYYADLFYSLEEECMQRKYQVVYSSLDASCDCKALLQKQNPWGIILVSCANDALINEAVAHNIPIVLLNRNKTHIASVTCNHLEGSLQAMQYLYKNGHREIALICGKEGHLSNIMKLSGCLYFAQNHGFTIKKENITYGNWEFEGGYDCAQKLLSGKAKQEMPTAIFSFNDAMAMGAIRAIEDLGLRVREDISIIGFDNMTQLRYFSPSLTTVDANTGEIAKVALDIIAEQAVGKDTNKTFTLVPVKLVEGNTVRDINN